LQQELDANPFLRPGSAEIRQNLDMPNAEDVEVFAQIRRNKDQF
jgi:hydroxyacylglutathione hydrolase